MDKPSFKDDLNLSVLNDANPRKPFPKETQKRFHSGTSNDWVPGPLYSFFFFSPKDHTVRSLRRRPMPCVRPTKPLWNQPLRPWRCWLSGWVLSTLGIHRFLMFFKQILTPIYGQFFSFFECSSGCYLWPGDLKRIPFDRTSLRKGDAFSRSCNH